MYKWKLTGKEVRPGDKASLRITLESGTEQTLVVWVASPIDADNIKVYAEENINYPSGVPLYPKLSDLRIEKVPDNPKYWPPEIGDVWRTKAGAHVYKVYKSYNSESYIMAETGDSTITEKWLLDREPYIVFRMGGIK